MEWSYFISMVYHRFIFIAGIICFAVGALLIINKDAMEKVSAFCNRWISTDKLYKILDSVPTTLDGAIMARAKLVGAIILVLSIVFILEGLSVL